MDAKSNSIKIVHDDGSVTETSFIPGWHIAIKGTNNNISFHEKIHFRECAMNIGSNNVISIGKTPHIVSGVKLWCANSNILTIGEDFSCLECQFRLGGDNKKVSFGADCMLSQQIFFFPSDGHTIFDADTKELINPDQDIIIGNHVWIGARVALLKGAKIADNSVIGFGSIVTGSFDEPNVVLAGYPAKIIKHNINWNRTNPAWYVQPKMPQALGESSQKVFLEDRQTDRQTGLNNCFFSYRIAI